MNSNENIERNMAAMNEAGIPEFVHASAKLCLSFKHSTRKFYNELLNKKM